jgi:hypothetical protein
VIERGGKVCRDTILERKGPGLKPLFGVAPLYCGVVAGLDRGLARVFLEVLGLQRGFLTIYRLERQLGSGG